MAFYPLYGTSSAEHYVTIYPIIYLYHACYTQAICMYMLILLKQTRKWVLLKFLLLWFLKTLKCKMGLYAVVVIPKCY